MPPPNILLITSDQQHYRTLGCTDPQLRTPALDRLAREGTRFNRAYCVNPVCSPSRSTRRPFTQTSRTPTDNWCGSAKVARSMIAIPSGAGD